MTDIILRVPENKVVLKMLENNVLLKNSGVIGWVADHNSLLNIQGGELGGYYHLKSSPYTFLMDQDQSVLSGASPTFDGTNFTGIPIGALPDVFVLRDGSKALTASWDAGAYSIKANLLDAPIFTNTLADLAINASEDNAVIMTLGGNTAGDRFDIKSLDGTQTYKFRGDGYFVTRVVQTEFLLGESGKTLQINSAGSQDIRARLGDDVGGNKYSFVNHSLDEVASIDSLGLGTFVGLEADSVGIGTARDAAKKLIVGGTLTGLDTTSINIGTTFAPASLSDGQYSAVGGFALIGNDNLQGEKSVHFLNGINGLSFSIFNDTTRTIVDGAGMAVAGAMTLSSTLRATNIWVIYCLPWSNLFNGALDAENLYGIQVVDADANPGGTIVNQFGIVVEKPTRGTNNYQFVLNEVGDGSGAFIGGVSGVRLFASSTSLLEIDKSLKIATDLIVAEKSKLTSIGGLAVKLTNRTGANTIAGQLVKADTGDDDSFVTAGANADNVIGIVLDADVADGAEAWVVGGGIAAVLMDAGGSVRGDRLISSATAGSADVWNTGGAVATHFQEIGHCIETRVGAGLARCKVHFN